MTKSEQAALKKALQSPGMQAHINRLKAAWKNKNPSQIILYTWVKHKLAKDLYHEMLTSLSISELIAMKQAVREVITILQQIKGDLDKRGR